MKLHISRYYDSVTISYNFLAKFFAKLVAKGNSDYCR